MIPPRLFHIMSFFRLPGLVKRDFFHWRQTQPVPRESIGHYTGLGQGILLELNPNILVRDEERMSHPASPGHVVGSSCLGPAPPIVSRLLCTPPCHYSPARHTTYLHTHYILHTAVPLLTCTVHYILAYTLHTAHRCATTYLHCTLHTFIHSAHAAHYILAYTLHVIGAHTTCALPCREAQRSDLSSKPS